VEGIMKKVSALEKKYTAIEDKLREQTTFYMEDVQAIFPDMKKSSIYWNLSKMVEAGYLKRVRTGVYAFNEWKGKTGIALTEDIKKVQEVLDESGFEYFVSGLDVLQRFMQHVPEQYPMILFAEKYAHNEIINYLIDGGFAVVKPAEIRKQYEDAVIAGIDKKQVIVYDTENFDYENDGIATIEKAFADLCFSITRNGYPLSLQELVRVYQNLVRLGNIDKKKLITVSTKRNLQSDIRLIAETPYITEAAMQFAMLLRKDE
jgi:predicted transcriptional regulator of viral defense system